MNKFRTPWSFGTGNDCHSIYDANGVEVCRVHENLKDRFLIVKAVNVYAAALDLEQEIPEPEVKT